MRRLFYWGNPGNDVYSFFKIAWNVAGITATRRTNCWSGHYPEALLDYISVDILDPFPLSKRKYGSIFKVEITYWYFKLSSVTPTIQTTACEVTEIVYDARVIPYRIPQVFRTGSDPGLQESFQRRFCQNEDTTYDENRLWTAIWLTYWATKHNGRWPPAALY